ncbi:OmpA family protein [Luteimonas aquatica]|uniref:OmpA family protein n=1 Tax=Luteimonas aquatica TaxID=450364 RepID=UPI001F592C1C|nr:OmpA family protein [Luteimonas aquatica]
MNRSTYVCVAASALVLALSACSSQQKNTRKNDKSPSQQETLALPYVQKLSADGLFAFGKADLSNLSEGGRGELDALATRALASNNLDVIHVIGHSDRIGNQKSNLALSTRRANAVRDYLVQRGIPAEKITAVGRGSVEPVVECKTEKAQALIDCLAPNRRVEIRVVPRGSGG